jgi:hypothetical protein
MVTRWFHPEFDNPTMKRFLSAAGWVALGLLGMLAGFGLYMLSGYILLLVGFSFYAVGNAYFLAFAIWLVGAPVLSARSKKRDPLFKRNLMSFLARMLAFHVVTCLAVAIYSPQAILFWPR